MTKLLERAVASAGELSEGEQDALGQILLDEMHSERGWDERFAKRSSRLSALADRAWGEHEAGDSEALDVERL